VPFSEHVHKLIFDYIRCQGCNQFVDSATREANFLDLILTDDDGLITSVKWCPTIGLSDLLNSVWQLHLLVVIIILRQFVATYGTVHGDYENMLCYLAIHS